jgi:hypothetical protein
MLRKSLVIAAIGVALAAPSPAFAMHGPREQPPRVPRDAESAGSFARAPIVFAAAASSSFSWRDAGIGASVTGGCVLVLVVGRLVIIHRRSRVQLHQVS